MAVLSIPDQSITLTDPAQIRAYLAHHQIFFDQWPAPVEFAPDATQEDILEAYSPVLKPYMEANGYKVADVINVTEDTPNLRDLRLKFLAEHIHSEDEVRFFVDGQGYFWFRIDETVFNVLCQSGDLLSVPAGYPHWFDLGTPAFVKAIRIFIDASGWVPVYTESGVDKNYNPQY